MLQNSARHAFRFGLLLLACTLCKGAEPQHYGYKPMPQTGVVTPRDFVAAWMRREIPDYINPCLAISLPASRDYIYAPGFDLMWFSGRRTIRQFLQWNGNEFNGSPSNPRGDLTLYIAGAQGFIGVAGDKDMTMDVWDQCLLEAVTKTQRQVPGPAYFADYAMMKYGIEVPDQVLREVVANYWPGVDNDLYGAGCDRGCLGTTSNWTGAPLNVCGCNPKLVAELKRFSVFDPSGSTAAKPYPNTRQCLQQLVTGGPAFISIYSFRAAVDFCFNASPLQTGNGLGWRPATDDGYAPGFYNLLSFPEYVQPNYPVKRLRAVAGLTQLSVL